jgi:hypothetical protein
MRSLESLESLESLFCFGKQRIQLIQIFTCDNNLRENRHDFF